MGGVEATKHWRSRVLDDGNGDRLGLTMLGNLLWGDLDDIEEMSFRRCEAQRAP